MTIQIELFVSEVKDNQEANKQAVKRMQDEMNEFLLDKEDTDIKKIDVALGATQRMGLIEYKIKDEDNVITLNNFKEEGM